MSNPEDQTRDERFILDKFFSVMGIKADSIHPGPIVNGNRKPDFVVCIAGKQIGIEETKYYRKLRPDELHTRQAKEKAWYDLKTVIEKARRGYSELNEVHGKIGFRDFTLPSSKEYEPFAKELIEFIMNMTGGFNSDYTYETFDEKCPLLNKYVEYLKLQQVGIYMFWDWGHEAECVKLQKEELLGIIQAKIDKHVQSQVDEHWLLITSRTQLSQNMGRLSVGVMNKYEDICNLLNDGPFDKVYIYNYMLSRVIFWTLNRGWVDC